MRSTRALLLVTAVATLALTGCSTTVAGTPAPVGAAAPAGTAARATTAPAPPAAVDAATWTNQLCTAVTPLYAVATRPPPIDHDADLAARTKGVADYLGREADAADRTLTQLDTVAPAPAAAADVVPTIAASVTRLKGSLADAEAVIDAADPHDEKQLHAALTQVVARLKQNLENDPAKDLVTNPVFAANVAKAPACLALGKLTAGAG